MCEANGARAENAEARGDAVTIARWAAAKDSARARSGAVRGGEMNGGGLASVADPGLGAFAAVAVARLMVL